MKYTVPKEYYKMLKDLQAIDFVLVELNLYLDTHPHDGKAIKQFNQFSRHRQKIKEAFEARFGPLTGFGHSYSRVPWEWSKAPWPWQV